MKQIRNFLSGLIVLILTFSTSAYAGTGNPINKIGAPLIKYNFLKLRNNKQDSYFIFFGITATATSTPGYYSLTVTYNEFDATAGTSQDPGCPANVEITINTGAGQPFNGDYFTFPSGATSLYIGTYAFDPEGDDFPITSSPTSLNTTDHGTLAIEQYLIGGYIYPH